MFSLNARSRNFSASNERGKRKRILKTHIGSLFTYAHLLHQNVSLGLLKMFLTQPSILCSPSFSFRHHHCSRSASSLVIICSHNYTLYFCLLQHYQVMGIDRSAPAGHDRAFFSCIFCGCTFFRSNC